MRQVPLIFGRRHFLKTTAFASAAFTTPGLFAEELSRTPRQTEGPFYPDKLPLDTDNDLLIVNDNAQPSLGEVTHLTGRVLSPAGEPVRNAVVEIWQVDNNGIYIHTGSPKQDERDKNFQGFGRFLTGANGEYYFRTIKPLPYTIGIERTPHIHFAVNKGSKRMLTTQMYVKGEPMNKGDRIFQSLPNDKARQALLVDFKPIENSKIGELAANFDIILGHTPEDPEKRQPRPPARRAR